MNTPLLTSQKKGAGVQPPIFPRIIEKISPLDFAIQIAKEAGTILMKYYRATGIQANQKADKSAVTEGDLAADKFLRHEIQQGYPQDGLISEEAGTIYPEGKSAVWVIDPLDGTTNFSLGLHHWGVAINRCIDGIPELTALYFPIIDELFTAQRDEGAWLNGERLKVKLPDENQPFAFFSCCTRTIRAYNIHLRYKTRVLGTSAYGLSTVARGNAVLAFEATPKIWDFAGSWLLTEEAGGVIRVIDGSTPFPLVSGTDYKAKSYPILAAATPGLWAEGQKNINPKK